MKVYECMHMLVCVWGAPALTVLSTLLPGSVPTSTHLLWNENLVQIYPEAASIMLKDTFWGPSDFLHLIVCELSKNQKKEKEVCELNSLSLSFPSCNMGQVEDSSPKEAMRNSPVRWCLVFSPLCQVDI